MLALVAMFGPDCMLLLWGWHEWLSVPGHLHDQCLAAYHLCILSLVMNTGPQYQWVDPGKQMSSRRTEPVMLIEFCQWVLQI